MKPVKSDVFNPFNLFSGPRNKSRAQSRGVMKKRLLQASSGRCCYCTVRLTLDTITMDHVHPQQLSGPDVYENLVAACADCNCAKGSMRPSDWFRARPILASGFLLFATHVSAHYRMEAAVVLEALDSPYAEGPCLPIPRLAKGMMASLRASIAAALPQVAVNRALDVC